MKNAQQPTIADIAAIIRGRPASPLSALPQVWRDIAENRFETRLTQAARAAYVEAARLFRFHGTKLAMESLSAIGGDFAREAYPDFRQAGARAKTPLARKTVAAVESLFGEFGHEVPASFYAVLLDTALRDEAAQSMPMFKDKAELMRDRLQDAVLHAMLLITPVGLRIQSVFSAHGLRFIHLMNCDCKIEESAEGAFSIALNETLKPAYLQNMLAAAFEQYGVNAATSRAGRGF